MYRFSIFLSLVSFFITFFIGYFVYAKKPTSRLNFSFLVFSILASIWAFNEFIYKSADNYDSAFFWIKINNIWWPLTIASFFNLAVTYGEDKFNFKILKNPLRFIVIYLPAFFVIMLFLLPGNVTGSIVKQMPWGWIDEVTSVEGKITYYWGLLLGILSLSVYAKCYFSTNNLKLKKQVLIFGLGVTAPVILGLISEIVIRWFDILIPELITFGLLMSDIIFAYAIWKLDLFEINANIAANNIISSMPEALFMVDVDGLISNVNAASSKLLGFTEDQLLNKNISLFFENSISEKNYEIETYALSSNKEKIPVLVCNSPIYDGKNHIGYVIIGKDLRLRKKALQEKEKIQKQAFMNSTYASIGTLAAGVAHEVNNPLLIIRGYVDFLKEDIEKKTMSKDKANSNLNKMQRAVERINNITRGLNVYSKPLSDIDETVDLHDIIIDTVLFISIIFKNDKIDISMELKATKILIKAHKGNIRQIFLNVLSNARDALIHSDTRKKIIIKTCNIGDKISISFVDSGVGMSAETIENIFDPFFTTKDPSKGTGLGLSIVQSIVHSINGDISVESELGKGTIIKINIPVLEKNL